MEEKTIYLIHHGVKGKRWGYRRYQNIDGSLTEAGRKRLTKYNKKVKKLKKKIGKPYKQHLDYQSQINALEIKKAKAQQLVNQYASSISTIKQLDYNVIQKGKRYVRKIEKTNKKINILTSVKHSDLDNANSLTHYGVKGMKWRHHKSGLVTLDIKSPTEKALDTIKERLEGEKKTKELLANKRPTEKSKSLGEAEIAKLSSSVIRGNYGNGRARIKKLKSQGYSSNDIIRIQSHVNKQYGINNGASENFKKQVSEEFGSAAKASSTTSTTKSKSSSSKTESTKTKKTKKASSGSTRKKTSSNKSRRKKSITKTAKKSLDKIEEEIKKNE